MSKKNDKPGDVRSAEAATETGVAIANPVGKSRRRLLRALGGAGGAGLGAILASNWNRPVVESVLLPVHAQTTGPGSEDPPGETEDPPGELGCGVTMALTINHIGTTGETLALQITPQSATVQTTSVGFLAVADSQSGTNSVSGSISVPPGSYLLLFLATALQSISFTAAATCCADSLSTEQTVNSAASTLFPFAALVDPGSCTLSIQN